MSAETVNEVDDITLLQQIAAGDQSAFSVFYDRFSGVLFSFIVRIVRSEAESEDILQEVFWQIWSKASSYRPDLGSPFSWSVTIARRKAIDRLRSLSRHLDRIEEARTARTEDDVALPTGGDALDAKSAANAVRTALTELPPEQRRAVQLAFFDGLTHVEIATALDAPIGTIKARIRRGMEKLRTPLAHISIERSVDCA